MTNEKAPPPKRADVRGSMHLDVRPIPADKFDAAAELAKWGIKPRHFAEPPYSRAGIEAAKDNIYRFEYPSADKKLKTSFSVLGLKDYRTDGTPDMLALNDTVLMAWLGRPTQGSGYNA